MRSLGTPPLAEIVPRLEAGNDIFSVIIVLVGGRRVFQVLPFLVRDSAESLGGDRVQSCERVVDNEVSKACF